MVYRRRSIPVAVAVASIGSRRSDHIQVRYSCRRKESMNLYNCRHRRRQCFADMNSDD